MIRAGKGSGTNGVLVVEVRRGGSNGGTSWEREGSKG